MRKDILAKAVSLAEKSVVRPERVVVAKPGAGLFVKKPVEDVLSERLNTRITKSELKRLKARVGTKFSALLRDLIIQYLDKTDYEHR